MSGSYIRLAQGTASSALERIDLSAGSALEVEVAATNAPGASAPIGSAISNQATVDGNEVDPDGSDNVATAQLGLLGAVAAAIPTLGEWAMLLMTLLLAAAGLSRLRPNGHAKR